jgi:uroporphyrin-3 C-methyltransferase
LLTLEDKDYLRQGLWLQVESTRLALMRSDVDVYTASLGRVSDTIDEYFQQSSPGVQKVQARVRELQQLDIAPVMPDISAPWTRLRQLRDSRRLLQPAPPPENAESGQ